MIKFCISILLLLSACSTTKEESQITQEYNYLALGDSYTIGESVAEKERWPIQLRDSLVARGASFGNVKIIATTGWRTDDLSEAMDNANLKPDYNLVSLLIGVNNQYQGRSVEDYKPEFKALLARAIQLAGDDKDKVFVVSIPDYAYTAFGQTRDTTTISEQLASYNAACKELTLEAGVKHVDITPISLQGVESPNLVASDGLHPSGDQYSLWVSKILEQVF